MPEYDTKTVVTSGFSLQAAPKTVSVTHTTGSLANYGMVITVAWNDTLRTAPSGLWISDVKVNTNSTTWITQASTSGLNVDTFYYIGNGENVEIIFTTIDAGDLPYNMTIDYSVCVTSWAEGEQTYFVEQSNTATGTTSPITVSVTGTTEQHRLLDMAGAWSGSSSPPTLTAGAGQTDIHNATNGGGTMNWRSASSYKLSHPTSQSLSWTENTNRNWATVILELAPTPIIPFSQSQLAQTGAGLG